MKIVWEVDDGFAGGSRPNNTIVIDEELLDCDNEEEAMLYIEDCIYEDFDQKVGWKYLNSKKVERDISDLFSKKDLDNSD